jgi:hypothetical protein
LEWTFPHSPRLLLQTTLAYEATGFERRPAAGSEDGCRFGSLSGQCLDLAVGRTSGSLARPYADSGRSLRVAGKATFYAGRFWGGRHQLRGGYEIEDSRYRRKLDRRPDLLLAPEGGTSPTDFGRFGDGAAQSGSAHAASLSLYLEDLYRPGERVSITLGLRLDRRVIDSTGRTPFDPAVEAERFDDLDDGLVGADRELLAAETFTGYEEIEALVQSIGTMLGSELDCVGACGGVAPRTRREESLRLGFTNLSPMLALSWDPWGTGKDRIALSARRYHGEIPAELPLVEQEAATADLLVAAEPDALRAASFTVAPNALMVDRALRTPYQDEWTLGYEHELAPETSVQVSYVNRRFRRQLRYVQLNHRDAADGSTVLRNPYWGDVVQVRSVGRAEYEALVVELTRRQYRSWELHGSYTLSSSRGDGDGFDPLFADEGGQLPNLWGRQSDDRRHSFKLASTWISPWGIGFSGTLRWESGLPWSDLVQQVTAAEIPPELNGIAVATPRRTLLFVGGRNARRNGTRLCMDVRITKELSVARGVSLGIALEVFNLAADRSTIVYNPLRDVGRAIDGAEDARRWFGRRYQIGLQVGF